METCLSLTNTPNFLTPLSTNPKTKTQNFFQLGRGTLKLRQPDQQIGRFRSGLRMSVCGKGKWSAATELERKLEDEMKSMEEWAGVAAGKCRDGNGIVELMECLEREAIMGEDQGREPMDYNRRAHIFDKSSRVFQALKEISSSQNDS